MSKDRASLHTTLVEIMKPYRVYYQPPSSERMIYPCIVYDKNDYDIHNANDHIYRKKVQYKIMVIGKDPDNDTILDKILSLEYCSFDRRYKTSENLYHDVFTLYW